MQKKLEGYKRQDEKHEIYSARHFITLERVQQLLDEAKETCLYCQKPVLLKYSSRANDQWTLDRIDNRMGHNDGNVVIACLACNLQRRNRSLEKFKFSKQLKLVKLPANE